MRKRCEQCGELLGSCACRRRRCLDTAGDETLVFIDGHDDAILGVAEVEGNPRVVYDRGSIVHGLMRRDGMDEEGAEEFVDYNIEGCMVSPSPPIFLKPC